MKSRVSRSDIELWESLIKMRGSRSKQCGGITYIFYGWCYLYLIYKKEKMKRQKQKKLLKIKIQKKILKKKKLWMKKKIMKKK